MTEEQKKAASERMKAYHAARAAEKTAKKVVASVPTPELKSQEMAPEDIQSLLQRVKELEQMVWRSPAPQPRQGLQVGPSGRLVGTIEKYIVDPKHYPDPRGRLAQEPRLQRFAFRDNYELGWDVNFTQYETKDGLNMREPKFTLELIRIAYDEDTGEKTDGRYTVCKAVFHEDPQTALVIARENGLEVNEIDERTFLDEMRYLRMRDWLLEAFYPPKPVQPRKNKTEKVIGNKLVDFWEINSEKSETIPFSQLNKKG